MHATLKFSPLGEIGKKKKKKNLGKISYHVIKIMS